MIAVYTKTQEIERSILADRLISRLATFPKPTVARVNGHCLASGTGFMLACDIVVAKASDEFGTPEVNVGLFPMIIGALKNIQPFG